MFKKLFYICILESILCACGGEKKYKDNNVLERIENFSVDVTEDCIQIYENSYCRPTTAQIEGTDYMIAYSMPLHSIDLIALNGKSSFKQIKLERQGPDAVNDIRGLFYYDHSFVLNCSEGFCRVNEEGKIISKWSLHEFLEKYPQFSTRFPEKIIIYNLFQFWGFNEKEGLIALPLYKYEKINKQYPTRIILVSCHDWEVVEDVEISYPTQLKQEEWLGCLGEVQALPCKDKIIYNFPASSEIYIYDRIRRTTTVHSIDTKYTEKYYRCENEGDDGLSTGYFLPIRYDYRHNNYWRIQQKPQIHSGRSSKSCSVTRFSTNFEIMGEYDIPSQKGISSFSILFTEDKVLLPYLEGEYIGENNIAFYGLKLP